MDWMCLFHILAVRHIQPCWISNKNIPHQYLLLFDWENLKCCLCRHQWELSLAFNIHNIYSYLRLMFRMLRLLLLPQNITIQPSSTMQKGKSVHHSRIIRYYDEEEASRSRTVYTWMYKPIITQLKSSAIIESIANAVVREFNGRSIDVHLNYSIYWLSASAKWQ